MMRQATPFTPFFKALLARQIAGAAGLCLVIFHAQAHSESLGMQTVGRFEIDRTEVSIGEFRRFVQSTGLRTQAERAGGGSTYEAGWEQRPGWLWHSPYGQPGRAQEPVAHVSYPEAEAFCRWAGKRLPLDTEWAEAAYTERRGAPPAPFRQGQRYPYPTGDSPQGANCLGDCGDTAGVPEARTSRGRGHALVGSTRAGVNGLFEMGGNLWEWVDSGPGNEKRTRGGSWWYGSAPMRDDHRQTKPSDTAVVYIGFRCARTLTGAAARP
jgi:sulfatase modifying factor 1